MGLLIDTQACVYYQSTSSHINTRMSLQNWRTYPLLPQNYLGHPLPIEIRPLLFRPSSKNRQEPCRYQKRQPRRFQNLNRERLWFNDNSWTWRRYMLTQTYWCKKIHQILSLLGCVYNSQSIPIILAFALSILHAQLKINIFSCKNDVYYVSTRVHSGKNLSIS